MLPNKAVFFCINLSYLRTILLREVFSWEVIQMKEFGMLTFALGLMAGAYIVSTSHKAQNLVEKGSREIKKKISKMSK